MKFLIESFHILQVKSPTKSSLSTLGISLNYYCQKCLPTRQMVPRLRVFGFSRISRRVENGSSAALMTQIGLNNKFLAFGQQVEIGGADGELRCQLSRQFFLQFPPSNHPNTQYPLLSTHHPFP